MLNGMMGRIFLNGLTAQIFGRKSNKSKLYARKIERKLILRKSDCHVGYNILSTPLLINSVNAT
jgi:hypothetical protein